MNSPRDRSLILPAVFLLLLVLPASAHAYIGPGAGFVFVSSFFILIVTFFLAFVTLLTWPLRWVVRSLRGRRALARSRVRKVIVLGLDGLDPELAGKWMNEGLLPSFAKLRDEGSFKRLQTTLPAMSPVAWSSFQTGCNPGRHGIYDFLTPNRKNYLPELSSAQIGAISRTISIGPIRIPLSRPSIRLLRKSQPFWKILGEHGIFSNVLRVPITFPPEKFHGVMLSAMCVPDLKGTQGTFTYYTSDGAEQGKFTGGVATVVEVRDGVVHAHLAGPPASSRRTGANAVEKPGELRIPLEIRIRPDGAGAELRLDHQRVELPLRGYTPWISVVFNGGFGKKVRGICRFYLKSVEPHFQLYVSPVNIDPAHPALPISHPLPYSIYLAKTQGPFATLGLAEDTWALNEGILDEDAFLEQVWLNHAERERMFFDAVAKTSRGLVACVFDCTDRIQHMFWQYIDKEHPAARHKDAAKYRGEILNLYKRMDDLVGRTMATLRDDMVLMVMSDHGFKSFRRGVNLNTWLYQNGYMALKAGKPTGADWFQDVDWARTRAYAVGLGGIYLNLRGREERGIVEPGEEAKRVKKDIIRGLRELYDPDLKVKALRDVYAATEVYKGPYVGEAPDLIAGFNLGFRASWGCATGVIEPEVLVDNTKNWSGDHCVNPVDVPGVLFCNEEIERDNPHIMDIGPTVLDLFGVEVPAYCDGKPLMPEEEEENDE